MIGRPQIRRRGGRAVFAAGLISLALVSRGIAGDWPIPNPPPENPPPGVENPPPPTNPPPTNPPPTNPPPGTENQIGRAHV